MTFIIFWAAIFAIIFFLLGVVFKGMASVLNGLLNAISYVGVISFVGGIVLVALYLIFAIVNSIIAQGFGATIGMIALYALYLGILILFFGKLGDSGLSFIINIVSGVLAAVSAVLDFVSVYCESVYGYFLNVIVKHLGIN